MSAPQSDESSPAIRAADADRERTAGALATHAARGRLDAEELEERCQVAYRARTLAELERLTHDLPGLSASAPTPAPPPARASTPARGRPVRAQRTFQIALRVYAVLVALWVGLAGRGRRLLLAGVAGTGHRSGRGGNRGARRVLTAAR